MKLGSRGADSSRTLQHVFWGNSGHRGGNRAVVSGLAAAEQRLRAMVLIFGALVCSAVIGPVKRPSRVRMVGWWAVKAWQG